MPNPAAELAGVYDRVELWPTPETSLFEALPSAFQPSGASGSNGANCPDFPQPNKRMRIVAKPNHRATFIEPSRSLLMKTTKIMKSRACRPAFSPRLASQSQQPIANSQNPAAKVCCWFWLCQRPGASG